MTCVVNQDTSIEEVIEHYVRSLPLPLEHMRVASYESHVNHASGKIRLELVIDEGETTGHHR